MYTKVIQFDSNVLATYSGITDKYNITVTSEEISRSFTLTREQIEEMAKLSADGIYQRLREKDIGNLIKENMPEIQSAIRATQSAIEKMAMQNDSFINILH